MSDTNQIVMMQGYSQSYLIAKDDLIPDNIQLGPNFILKLPFDQADEQKPEFGFANPGSDIAGAINYMETYLSSFLTSRGLDPSIVSGKGQIQKASSGVQKYLEMIDHFDASRTDYSTYNHAEKQIYKVIKAWHDGAIGTDLLDKKYQSSVIADDSEVMINFSGPEMLQTEKEKVELWNTKVEAGFTSRLKAIMALEGLEEKEAAEYLKEVDESETPEPVITMPFGEEDADQEERSK